MLGGVGLCCQTGPVRSSPVCVVSSRVVSCRVVWCGVVWCRVVSCRVVWCHTVSVCACSLYVCVASPLSSRACGGWGVNEWSTRRASLRMHTERERDPATRASRGTRDHGHRMKSRPGREGHSAASPAREKGETLMRMRRGDGGRTTTDGGGEERGGDGATHNGVVSPTRSATTYYCVTQ